MSSHEYEFDPSSAAIEYYEQSIDFVNARTALHDYLTLRRVDDTLDQAIEADETALSLAVEAAEAFSLLSEKIIITEGLEAGTVSIADIWYGDALERTVLLNELADVEEDARLITFEPEDTVALINTIPGDDPETIGVQIADEYLNDLLEHLHEYRNALRKKNIRELIWAEIGAYDMEFTMLQAIARHQAAVQLSHLLRRHH